MSIGNCLRHRLPKHRERRLLDFLHCRLFSAPRLAGFGSILDKGRVDFGVCIPISEEQMAWCPIMAIKQHVIIWLYERVESKRSRRNR